MHIWPDPVVNELAIIEELVSAGALGASELLSGMVDSLLKTEVGKLLRHYGIEPDR